MTKIAIVCFDGVTDIDVFLHWDILNRPRTMFPNIGESWEVALLGTSDTHITQAGLVIPTHGTIDQASKFDAVVHASGPAARRLMKDEAYIEVLALSPPQQIVASQCSGALILAASGCLNGLTYDT